MRNHSNRGAVLISALLFTTILTLIALNLLQSSILANKLSHYFRNKNLALIAGEKRLNELEQKIKKNQIPEEAKLISNRICGVMFYRISATGRSGTISQRIQSTYAVKGDLSQCQTKPLVEEGRQSWRII